MRELSPTASERSRLPRKETGETAQCRLEVVVTACRLVEEAVSSSDIVSDPETGFPDNILPPRSNSLYDQHDQTKAA